MNSTDNKNKYRDFLVNSLNDMTNYINNLTKKSQNIIKSFSDLIKEIKNQSIELKEKIDSYILFLQANDIINKNFVENKEKHTKEIENNLKIYNDNIILFFENNNINKIKELHYKLNDAMNGISLSDFNPNNINSINSSSIINISSYYNEP